MELKDILLKKGEVPVVGNHVFVPIHPKLILDKNIKIDQNIAHEVFPIAVKEWYNDMKEYVNTTDDNQTKFLFNQIAKSKKPLIKKIDRNHAIRPEYTTIDNVEGMLTNGLVRCFAPFGGGHGSLGLGDMSEDGEGFDCKEHISPYNTYFSEEKFREYSYILELKDMDFSNGIGTYAYTQHNVDIYFQASLLEVWVRHYLNEALKQVLE